MAGLGLGAAEASLAAAVSEVRVQSAVADAVDSVISRVCEEEWKARVESLTRAVHAAREEVRELALREVAGDVQRRRVVEEAKGLRVKFELQLWDVAKQLQEKKRVESELLSSRMREDELGKQVEETRRQLAARERDIHRSGTRVTGELLFFRLPRHVFVRLIKFLPPTSLYHFSTTAGSLSARLTHLLHAKFRHASVGDASSAGAGGDGPSVMFPGSGIGAVSMGTNVGQGLDPKTLEQLAKGNKHQKRVYKRLGQLEADLAQANLERQDLSEKFRTSDSVKEFLAEKLKEKDAEVRAATAAKDQANAQSLSDREVIMYLDGRVRSLEQAMADAQDHLKTVDEKAEMEQSDYVKKMKVLEDMLALHQVEKKHVEATFKKEKKLLISEVKKLRSHVKKMTEQLAARDEELARLRSHVGE